MCSLGIYVLENGTRHEIKETQHEGKNIWGLIQVQVLCDEEAQADDIARRALFSHFLYTTLG